jgi:eukaryotic-like serine/threonine-protein kinase
MAEVFKAEHRHLGQIRALKLLLPEIAARPEIVGRLLTEARAMARLRHPAITEVYDCDVLDETTAFIAMEYLCGEPLRCWLERVGKLANRPLLAGAIAGVLGEGLAFAHAAGIVHRDLKPENVVMVADPAGGDAFSLKILDFGVAKLLRETPLTTTRNGCVIGTPLYMAPEQWRPNSAIDHRADIYALGCLLFEILTGQPPFDGPDDVAIMNAHQNEAPPDVNILEPDLPAGFQPLLARMMAKSADDRHQSMDELLADLEQVMGLERTGWGDLLRTPPEFPVVTREAVGSAPTQQAMVVVRSPPELSAPMFEEAMARSVTAAARRRLAMIASIGLAVVGLVMVGILLLTRDEAAARSVQTNIARPTTAPAPRAAAPTPAAPAAAPSSITSTPIPSPAPPAPTYLVRVTSVPTGAEVWFLGESSPRGRTPVDLLFQTRDPQLVRLVAPGFRPETIAVSPDPSSAPVSARLTPLRSGRPAAARPREERAAPPLPRSDQVPAPTRVPGANVYRPVAD